MKNSTPTAAIVTIFLALLLLVALVGGGALFLLRKQQATAAAAAANERAAMRAAVLHTYSHTHASHSHSDETSAATKSDVDWQQMNKAIVAENMSLKEQIEKQKKLIELYENQMEELNEALGREPLTKSRETDL